MAASQCLEEIYKNKISSLMVDLDREIREVFDRFVNQDLPGMSIRSGEIESDLDKLFAAKVPEAISSQSGEVCSTLNSSHHSVPQI